MARLCKALAILFLITPATFTYSTPAALDIVGKIAGRVTDAATGDPLPGVNVVIVGTTQGASTDIDGYYTIVNLKPGKYSVRASFIGFAAQVVEEVEVIVDKTTRVDFELMEQVFEGQEVVITAERGLVQVDRTTTTAVVNSEQLAALPVTSLDQAINLQAGVVDGRFRGGRSGEVAFLVNGVPINNAYNNQAAFDVEQNMVASLEVISGVFNAEYGQALSGVVNIVTKDVADDWSGSFLGYVGTLASSKELEFVDRTTSPGSALLEEEFQSERVSFASAADLAHIKDFQLTAGGPVIKDRFGVQATYRFLGDNGYIFGRDLFSPSDSSFSCSPNPNPPPEQICQPGLSGSEWLIESTGGGEIVPLRTNERHSLNVTANVRVIPSIKLDYNLFLQYAEQKPYDKFWKYVPEGINDYIFQSQTHIVGLRYTIGNKSFGNISYSYLRDEFDSRLFELPADFDEAIRDANGDPVRREDGSVLTCRNAGTLRRNYLDECKLNDGYQSPRLGSLVGQNASSVGGNWLGSDEQQTVTHTIVADFSSQLDRIHLMKAGILARLHNIENLSYGIEKSITTQFTAQVSPNPFSENALVANPIEFSAYVQDKMEFEGLIVNAGLRFDLFDPDYDIPIEWQQADQAEIVDPNNPDATISNRKAAPIRTQLSPRLGIAFPISSTGVMRFSAGMFFQIPSLSLLYTNPEYEKNPASSSVQFGNPELKPERTIAFEVGLQQGLTENIGMELTLFAKDVRNLTGQEIERDPRGDFLVRWINTDYGTIRGLTLSIFQRPAGLTSWTLDYTLQFAEGTSSDPGLAFERELAQLDQILSLTRLNWDRRHVLNGTFTLTPYEGFNVTFVGRLRSGEPYTSLRSSTISSSSGFGFVRSTEVNNADRPWQFFSDLRLYFKPKVLKYDVQLFLQVENLFDTRQQYNVYATSGRADEAPEQGLAGPVGGVNTLDEWFFNQDWFGGPRRVSLGLRLGI